MAGDHSINLWLPGPEWEGEDAFLIGGGPSLKEFDFTKLAGLNTIGCNDAYHLGTDIIQICLFSDRMWWERNKHALEHFHNRVVTNCAFLLNYNLPNILKMDRVRDGLAGGTTLGWNFSTGASAIALAVRLKASRIFLLGYDLGNEGQKSHWHHYNSKVIREDSFQGFIRGFERVKKDLPEDVQVFNVTKGTSRLKCFQEITFKGLDSVLPAKEVA